ncbi:MAG: response regulator [Spirochaetia bacterium]|nr:response regulator [Spirochaetia bacterium]
MKKRVLYIEDSEQNMYLIRYILEAAGYEILQAKEGETGLKIAKSELPDMILLDIQLPVMDGYEVAKRLRKIPETMKIPVVALSSYAMVGDREKALAAGCTGYIDKPINPEKFVKQIEQYLEKKQEGV